MIMEKDYQPVQFQRLVAICKMLLRSFIYNSFTKWNLIVNIKSSFHYVLYKRGLSRFRTSNHRLHNQIE